VTLVQQVVESDLVAVLALFGCIYLVLSFLSSFFKRKK
jgi:hypothetical protein